MSSMKRILPVLTVLFLGSLGFSLAIPLFPPLFLEKGHSFLPQGMSIETRRILLGILFAMYPLGQFLGAPLLGKLSDKYGRKPILLLSLIIVIPAYLGCAFSVKYALPYLLFISRFFSGLLEGNVIIAQAAIADISEDTQTKTKNFGWFVSLGSTAFFFGPLIGGKLADQSFISWFHFDTPFWGAALLSLVGFFIVLKFFRETHAPDAEIKVSMKTITRSFTDGLNFKSIRMVYVANLFIYLGSFFFLNFFTAYLLTRFHFSVAKLGEINAYLAIPFILAPIFFGKFAKWWTSRQSMRLGCFCLCIAFLVFIIPSSPWALLITLLPIGFFQSMGFAFPAIMISDGVSKNVQGLALGTNQSIQVFAEGATALCGGLIMAFGITFPIYAATVCAFIGGLILFIRPPRVDVSPDNS
ncbi:MAG: MFS transporter [Chlamydiia bacterium]|nr:MFS transporter [Chlamydiia bacterium]